MPHRRSSPLVAAVLWLGVCAPVLEAADRDSGGPVRRSSKTTSRPASEGKYYFGVMGEAVHPGVYESKQPTPLLVEVLRRAGGLTPQATGNIRIVRDGRSGQQVFYSPNAEFRLVPGDLLLVDGDRHGHRRNVPAGTRGAGSQTVELAFLNLLPRPVVLSVRPEHATVARIVKLLGQKPSVLETVSIIETGVVRSQRGPRLDPHVKLQSGSVLVFDPAAIDAESLPQLPAPNAVDREAQPRRLDVDTDEPQAMRVAEAPSPGASEGGPKRDDEGGGETGTEEGPADDRAAPLLVAPRQESGLDTTRKPAEPGSATNASRGATSKPPTPSGGEPAARDASEEGVRPARAASGAGESGLIGRIGLLVAAVSILCIAVLYAYLRRRAVPQRGEKVVDAEPTAVPEPLFRELDVLIAGQTAIDEEPVRLPNQLRFYGKPSRGRRLRVDAAHPGGGPRRPHVRETGGRAERPAAADEREVELLDRTLSGIHGATRS